MPRAPLFAANWGRYESAAFKFIRKKWWRLLSQPQAHLPSPASPPSPYSRDCEHSTGCWFLQADPRIKPALNLLRRLPQSKIEDHLSALVNLLPDLSEDLLVSERTPVPGPGSTSLSPTLCVAACYLWGAMHVTGLAWTLLPKGVALQGVGVGLPLLQRSPRPRCAPRGGPVAVCKGLCMLATCGWACEFVGGWVGWVVGGLVQRRAALCPGDVVPWLPSHPSPTPNPFHWLLNACLCAHLRPLQYAVLGWSLVDCRVCIVVAPSGPAHCCGDGQHHGPEVPAIRLQPRR